MSGECAVGTGRLTVAGYAHSAGEKHTQSKIYVVGIGPGGGADMTPRARAALGSSDVVVGYTLYLNLIENCIRDKETISTGMTGETERCRRAVEEALAGRVVSVVSSGDAGIYGMAGLVLALAQGHPELSVEVVPGVTAASASAAVLGAPLGHDFAVISLSDLLTDWSVIERRLRAAAGADFAICLYNPSSKKRAGHLKRACAVVLEHRDPATPCGFVRNAGRPEESHRILTLGELCETPVDMFTTVIIGSSRTQILGGRLVTPRGYGV